VVKEDKVKFLVVALALVAGAAAAAQMPAAPLDPKVLVWDKGTDRIDVSKYPPEIRQKYKVFVELCGQCHTLARAVNCDFVLDEDWERYIKKMMRRGKGLVTPETARTSYEFATYDSKIRKQDLYEKRLKEAARQ
jgi:hypothetical protein